MTTFGESVTATLQLKHLLLTEYLGLRYMRQDMSQICVRHITLPSKRSIANSVTLMLTLMV